MQLENSSSSYGTVARTFHWLVAGLIVVQFILAPIPEELPPGMHIVPPFGLDAAGVLARHKSFGMTVLLLMIVRLFWRRRSPAPALPVTMKPLQRRLAYLSHGVFYIVLFAMPLSGWMMVQAKGSSASWFGLWTWPTFLAQSDAAFRAFSFTHEILSRVLFFLALLHVAAALKHHFWDKDGVLVRMLPFGRSQGLASPPAGVEEAPKPRG
ncbi:MAG: cytochrome b [Pseudomonadota bacterium]|nr:cytochrome b [Pseudomonadota bacterium]